MYCVHRPEVCLEALQIAVFDAAEQCILQLIAASMVENRAGNVLECRG